MNGGVPPVGVAIACPLHESLQSGSIPVIAIEAEGMSLTSDVTICSQPLISVTVTL